jgi:transaldolase
VNRLQELHEAGVSIWLDTLSRDLLDTGEFARLVDEWSVTGATSNPTIFEKAMRQSHRYDDQLHEILSRGPRDARVIFFDLALEAKDSSKLMRPPALSSCSSAPPYRARAHGHSLAFWAPWPVR